MYCRNCGKFIDGNETLCEDCKQTVAAPVQTQPQQQPQQTAAPKGASPRMLAFKPSLAAVITGAVGYVFMMVAYIYAIAYAAMNGSSFAAALYQGEAFQYGPEMMTALQTLTWVFFVMAIPLCVVALVFGIRSLLTVVRAKKAGAPMAIAPLILSICAIGAAALSVLFGLVVLTVFAAI